MQESPPPRSVEEVKAMLESTEKGGVRNSIRNCLTVFQNDPLLSGAIAKNLLTERTDIIKPIGYNRTGTAITDTDMNYLLLYLEETYGLTSEKKIAAAIGIVANENGYHPIRDYLNGLSWDGTERIRTCLHHFLGADSDQYTYEALRLFLLGAIHRAFHPGCKFEVMLCLVGGHETDEGYRLKTKPFGIDESRAGAFPIGNQKPLLTESFGLLVQGNFGRIALKNSRGEEVVIEVTVDSITVDRSKSGDLSYFDDVDPKLFKKEDLLVSTTKRYMRGNVNMEIIFDVSYLEIYADGGLETASVCVYPDAPYQVVSTDGDLEVKMYTIKK